MQVRSISDDKVISIMAVLSVLFHLFNVPQVNEISGAEIIMLILQQIISTFIIQLTCLFILLSLNKKSYERFKIILFIVSALAIFNASEIVSSAMDMTSNFLSQITVK